MGYDESEIIIGLRAQEYFKKKLKDNKKLKGANKPKEKSFKEIKTTLLVFSANWAETCLYTHPMWIKFANRFTTANV